MEIGTWITVPHPTIVELLARQSFDWLCVDMEHSPTSRLDLQLSVEIIQKNGKKAYVRVPQNGHNEVKFPLDTGVDGIIIPMINSAEEARLAVENCFYPPKGRRGVGLARAQKFGFGFPDHYEKNLRDLELIVQVEHIQAVNEIDSILAVEGVSGVFLGPYDLSGSMNLTGHLNHPDVQRAIQKVADSTLRAQKKLGIHVIPSGFQEVKRYQELGYNFIAFSIDTYFLGQKVSDELELLKKGQKS